MNTYLVLFADNTEYKNCYTVCKGFNISEVADKVYSVYPRELIKDIIPYNRLYPMPSNIAPEYSIPFGWMPEPITQYTDTAKEIK